jgi:hypothetical protein
MQTDYHPGAFHFTNRPLVLRASVPEPPPKSVALHVVFMPPESRDYNTVAGASVPFRFDRERDGIAEYREAEAGESAPADAADVYTHMLMPAETAKLLHTGKLTSADIAAEVLGVLARATTPPPSDDAGLHGLSDAPGG